MSWFLSLPWWLQAILVLTMLGWISILVYLFRSVWDVQDAKIDDPETMFQALQEVFEKGLMTEAEYLKICKDIEARHPGTIRGRAAMRVEMEGLRRKANETSAAGPSEKEPPSERENAS